MGTASLLSLIGILTGQPQDYTRYTKGKHNFLDIHRKFEKRSLNRGAQNWLGYVLVYVFGFKKTYN